MARPRKHVSTIGEKSLKKNAARYQNRLNAPTSGIPLGPAPEHLSVNQKALWNELVSRVPTTVLEASDAFVIELTVRLTEKMRAGELKSSQIGQYRGCLASLGASPADRSRVPAPPLKPEKDELQKLLDGDYEQLPN